MSVEVHNPGDDTAFVRYVAPDELRVREPFLDLFPVKPAMLATIAGFMREHGFDRSKPINVWLGENVVVDGHTRRLAAIDAGIDLVPVCYHDFADEDEALCYAIANQCDRRNMTNADILRCIELVDKRKRWGGDRKSEEIKASRDALIGKSAAETADIVGVSQATVERARTVLDAADEEPDVKQAVLENKMSINAAAKEATKRKRRKRKMAAAAPPPVQSDPLLPTSATVEVTDEERAWLDSLCLRPQVDACRFDVDALIYCYFSGKFEALRGEMLQRIGMSPSEFASTLYAAVDRLGSTPPPDTWALCPKCDGAGRVGHKKCHKCHGGGYVIPGF